MKEDILEQLIEDYYVSIPGWFAKHNVKYRPDKNHPDYVAKLDSVHSDIDIISLNGNFSAIEKVNVVSCKSWQEGFVIKDWLNALEEEASYNDKNEDGFQGREKWKYFRELVSDKWTDAFLKILEEETGQKNFTYIIAVTKLVGNDDDKAKFEQSQKIIERFSNKGSNMKLKFLTLVEIIGSIQERIMNKETPATEATSIGRILQLFHAAGITINNIQVNRNPNGGGLVVKKPMPKSTINQKDYTQYKLNGNECGGKGQLVLAVIKEHSKNNNNLTLEGLQKIFDKKLQGSLDVIDSYTNVEAKYAGKKKGRYFIDDDNTINLTNGKKIVVCTEWGINNIANFINKAKELGYNIEEEK